MIGGNLLRASVDIQGCNFRDRIINHGEEGKGGLVAVFQSDNSFTGFREEVDSILYHEDGFSGYDDALRKALELGCVSGCVGDF